MKQKKESKELNEAEQMEVVQKLYDFLKEKYEVIYLEKHKSKEILFWEKGATSGYVLAIIVDEHFISFGFFEVMHKEEIGIPCYSGLVHKSVLSLDDVEKCINIIKEELRPTEKTLFFDNIESIVMNFDDIT